MQGRAEVKDVVNKSEFRSIKVQLPPGRAANITMGASVAINGTCLTVVDIQDDLLGFDIIGETLRRTNLGGLEKGRHPARSSSSTQLRYSARTPLSCICPGSVVNFERSARVGDEIGGHTVSGHVHTTATIDRIDDTENNRRIQFRVSDPGHWMRYILPKVTSVARVPAAVRGTCGCHAFPWTG